MQTATMIMNGAIVFMFMSITWLFKSYWPKGINGLIGYRTKRSMSSSENWLLANSYASDLLFKCTLILPVAQFSLLDFWGNGGTSGNARYMGANVVLGNLYDRAET